MRDGSRFFWRLVAVGLLAGGALSCLDDSPLTPSPAAHLSFSAQLTAAVGDRLTARLYYRQRTAQAIQLVTLTSATMAVVAGSQPLRLDFDASRCFTDSARVPNDALRCEVSVELRLVDASSALVDSTTVQGIILQPGVIASLAAPVVLGSVSGVGSVVLSPDSATLIILQPLQLSASVLDRAGAIIAGKSLLWSSSDSTIATVSALGVVVTRRPGRVLISASTGGRSGVSRILSAVLFSDLAAGLRNSCGLSTQRELYCWGDDRSGQLGSKDPRSICRDAVGVTYPCSPLPLLVAPGVASMSIGGGHGCLLSGVVSPSTTNVSCWGENRRGQLGNGTTAESSVPAPVVGGLTFSSVSAGLGDHSCGLVASTVYCWGDNRDGALGIGTPDSLPHPVPAPVQLGALKAALIGVVSAGVMHSCAVAVDGVAYCWGRNDDGQLGAPSILKVSLPVAVSGATLFRSVSLGERHSCGLSIGGVAFCWGSNAEGQLGTGNTLSSAIPLPVSGGLLFTAITSGLSHSCGLTSAGQVYCWGGNGYGQLGNGATTNSGVPVAVASALRFTAVKAGGTHTCALADGPRMYCWGWNESGQLGSLDNTDRSVPVAVAAQP
ncbi:MAG: Ig-like domain-containing protein [Gemmatimonadota bacterium]|nr:Ig-like domain-containing protein [Gemmatimonadota bacterium]